MDDLGLLAYTWVAQYLLHPIVAGLLAVRSLRGAELFSLWLVCLILVSWRLATGCVVVSLCSSSVWTVIIASRPFMSSMLLTITTITAS